MARRSRCAAGLDDGLRHALSPPIFALFDRPPTYQPVLAAR
jgi:hypothetical protein